MDTDARAAKIAVIIPTYAPDERFRELLKRLYAQSLPPERIFVVNTDPDRFRDELVERWDRVSVFHIAKEEFDHAATRNMAARMVRAEILVFMTQDAVPADRHLLENLQKGFEAACAEGKEAAVVYARQLPRKEAAEAERYGRRFSYPPKSLTKTIDDLERLGIMTYTCSDVCAAYRRSLFMALGGFEEPAVFNEDMVFAAKAVKAGYAIRYEASARVIHSHSLTPMQQFRRNYALGMSQAQHPEVFEAVPSEGSGLRLVKGTLVHLVRKKKIHEIPAFITGAAFRYAGYKLGKNYEKLPDRIRIKAGEKKNVKSEVDHGRRSGS